LYSYDYDDDYHFYKLYDYKCAYDYDIWESDDEDGDFYDYEIYDFTLNCFKYPVNNEDFDKKYDLSRN
jgi:hypothetical protein